MTTPLVLSSLILGALALPLLAAGVDRYALVTRHNLQWRHATGEIPLGNGEFCFNADVTGLQTFSGNTMAHWGWHSFPPLAAWPLDKIPVTGTFQKGRVTGPDVIPPGAEDLRQWMWDNPHRLNLARIRLTGRDGAELQRSDISEPERLMNLWTGLHTARFSLHGVPVHVETCVHPALDAVSVRIESPLLADGNLEVEIAFPYPALSENPWVGDFMRSEGHSTSLISQANGKATIQRTIHDARYRVGIQTSGTLNETAVPHRLRITGSRTNVLEGIMVFGEEALPAEWPCFQKSREAVAAHWQTYWTCGGAIDLSGSKDPRWRELERRIVLSQYQMAVQSSGSFPPAETGLMGLDFWRGQFHMEMLWWHLAHYALWDRFDRAERALGVYQRFLPVSRKLAEQVGTKGAKWPKSVGPEGRSAPWQGNLVLLWKQPQPMFFAELEYRLRPTRATLEKWQEIIHETAEHMADYVTRDPATGLYSLNPSMPPSEQGITKDTVFDLAQWRWSFEQAQRWRERLGLPREPHWEEVRTHLAPLPVVDGCFVHSPEWRDTYTNRTWEHPDPVGVFGMLPPTQGVDQEVAHRTLLKIWKTWSWEKCWGWDFPWVAMAAARCGEPALAIDALLKEAGTKNAYDARGVNTGGPCPYLPGNGGLLYAVAMMAAGWDGAPDRPAPGFPADGSWTVRWEGLKPAP